MRDRTKNPFEFIHIDLFQHKAMKLKDNLLISGNKDGT
jgi:hypothetical protein